MAVSVDRRSARKLLFRVHTWIGLHVCLLLAIIFSTGTLLMFGPELMAALSPDVWSAPPESEERASVGETYDAILVERPGATIDIITAEEQRPWFGRVVYGGGQGGQYIAHTDVVTGEITGYLRGPPLQDIVRKVHDSLLIPFSFAGIIVNFLSFVILLMVVTGLISYRRFWKGYLRMPPASADTLTRRRWWHRLAGVWVAPFLIVSALSSSVFFLYDVGWEPKGPSLAPVSARDVRLPEGFAGAELDALVASCRERAPGMELIMILMPPGPAEALRIVGYDPAIGNLFGRVTCDADPASGEAVEIYLPDDSNLAARIEPFVVAVHYGTWGGWFSLLLWVIGGAVGMFLLLTGAQVYAGRIAREDAEPGVEPAGTWAAVIRGIGLFKWAYLFLVVGMVAVFVYRYVL